MTTLKQLALAALMATTSLASYGVWAQSAVEMTHGEVKKIDKDSQKITLKHGEIKNLEMPPMTMVFRTQDPTMLDKVHKGDKVRFSVERRDGAMVVTAIETEHAVTPAAVQK